KAAVSSAPVLTEFMFDWSTSKVGTLMAVLGLVVLPVNVIVGKMSWCCEDRQEVLSVLAVVGCLGIVDIGILPFRYTEVQYILGVSLIFVALQAHEGVIMSITSKVIPPTLARGTFNSGFLATEAGTFGRFTGDMLISLIGMCSLSSLDKLLFLPSALLLGIMMLSIALMYPFLGGF
ncbi:unnamed protein product, partial [Choristocarpus tenellus]